VELENVTRLHGCLNVFSWIPNDKNCDGSNTELGNIIDNPIEKWYLNKKEEKPQR